jgi:hypothetical protein
MHLRACRAPHFPVPTRLVLPDTLALAGDEFDVCRVALQGLGFTVESAPFALAHRDRHSLRRRGWRGRPRC